MHGGRTVEVRLIMKTLFPSSNRPVPLMYCAHCTCIYTVHMALVGYFIVFSFVTKPGQTLEFLLWGTIVPLNFLVGYYCSIVASTPQPMAYASNLPCVEVGTGMHACVV